ncbi:response regulator [Paenibacillus sp. LHD-117]|uniref:response regulator transcription factor n=1 Tax=Paenibacillus sp. LHD-117 TaxID=3071412 RepID=UPI0027E018BD|nr:response regulator [Paenibacillus sp. LHD-117]MDQ6422707.1 response regulator [Paenibacillus sp. LHD-117]
MYNVLIIDDEPWSREVVKALGRWEQLGLRVAGEAEDGTEGLRRIGELRPDIVVTDMRMPGVEGVELLRAVHDRHPEVKIIVMSGYDDFVYLKQAIRSKAIEYLLKPINPEELNAALAKCKEELGRQAVPLSSIFASLEATQRYASMRERVYSSLLALDKDGIAAAFEAMARGFALLETPIAEPGGASRVAGDLLLMLEQFLSEQDATLELLLPDGGDRAGLNGGGSNAEQSVQAVGFLFGQAVEALLTFRHSRSRLDMVDVRSYIDAHFQDAISLETVAGQFLVSREHLSRMFKSWSGENLSDYIVRKRMERARVLIAVDRLPIKHAAQLSGYEDIAYFYRVFKKHFGITPGDLRKEG